MHRRSLLAYYKILKLMISEFAYNYLHLDFSSHLNQFCKKCGRDEHIAWAVHDEIWNALPGKWGKERYRGVLCLDCFSELIGFKVEVKHFKHLTLGDYMIDYDKLKSAASALAGVGQSGITMRENPK